MRMKAAMRTHTVVNATPEASMRQSLLDAFFPHECALYFKASDYVSK